MSGFGRLRAIDASELELIRRWRNAPDVRSKMYTQHEIGAEEHRSWWQSRQGRVDEAHLIYEFEGVAAGVVAFTGIDPLSRHAAWAFYGADDAAPGTGSRMEFLALDHAFDALGLHKLRCEVLAFNAPVLRLHRKFGFRLEGTLREERLIDGAWVDVCRLGLLQAEWREGRSAMKTRIGLASKDRP